MRAVAVVVQIVISLVVAATLMPVVLTTMPDAQARSVGPAVALGIAAFAYAIVRIVWPRHKPEGRTRRRGSFRQDRRERLPVSALPARRRP